MNRQTILASINRHLRDSFAETGEVRPLGEIIPSVASDIRAHWEPGYAGITTSRVIPIEQVSAFVDGELTAAEAEDICDAVMIDNSVLAELIAAVRATHETNDQHPPLSDTLSAQLLAMKSELPKTDTVVPAKTVDSESRPPTTDAVPPPPVSVLTSTSQNGRAHPRTRKGRHPFGIAAAIVAVAASILAVVFFATRGQQPAPDDEQIANHDPVVPSVEPDAREVPETIPDSIVEDNDPVIVEIDNKTPSVPNKLEPIVPETPKSPSSDSVVEIDAPPEKMRPDTIPKPKLDNQTPVTPSTPSPPRLASLQWTKITGLLTERDVVSSAASASRPGNWRSVQSDSSNRGNVSLRTMPLSRAEANLDGGGKIVLSGDSGMQISRRSDKASAEIDLHHGAVAIINLPDGTVINLVHGDEVIASLRWTEKASAILERVATGFQVHVNHGTIAINDQPRQAESVNVANDHSVETIDRPKRLPSWVDRPTDSIGIPRNILAQIAQTDNVARTLSQRINELASAPRRSVNEQRELTTLANWQATVADAQIFRLANSRVPALRLAAIQRLVNMPETDGRYRRTWLAMNRTAANQQRVKQIRRWCDMARKGVRPNKAQTEQMILGLSSQDIAGRAMADFMLRQYYGNNVRFDPTATGAQQQQAINLWRKRVDLPATRNAAGAAALAPNRN